MIFSLFLDIVKVFILHILLWILKEFSESILRTPHKPNENITNELYHIITNINT